MAAGKSKRWGGYLGFKNKYLVEIDEEPIFARTIRLLKDNKVKEIYLSTNNEDLQDYPEYYYAENKTGTELDRFYNTKDLWDRKENIIYLYGDVYYTKEAMKTICKTKVQNFLAFGRYGGVKTTSFKSNELFAIKVRDKHLFSAAVDKVYDLYKKGEIKHCQGWQVYRVMLELPPGRGGKPNFKKLIIIDDITTDFDQPADYDAWITATKNDRSKEA